MANSEKSQISPFVLVVDDDTTILFLAQQYLSKAGFVVEVAENGRIALTVVKKKKPDIIAGIESRGFLFAAPVAHRLGIGLIVIRKRGKLPSETIRVEAREETAFEYLETHMESIDYSQKVLIVDDLIASGSTSVNAIDLVKKLGGEVVGFASVVDVVFLKGIEFIIKAHPKVDVLSLIHLKE